MLVPGVKRRDLEPGEFEAPRTGFFPSLRTTLNHLLIVDRYYIDAIERGLADQPANADFLAFFDPEVPCATVAALQGAQVGCDRRLLAVCRSLDPAALGRSIGVPRRGGVMQEPLPRLLAHLFQHQVHHRGQAHAMLSGTSVAPPQLDDFFCANDAALRADDFHTLGFSEAALWPPE